MKKTILFLFLFAFLSPLLINAQTAPLDGGIGDDVIVEEGAGWQPSNQNTTNVNVTGGKEPVKINVNGTQNQQTQFLQNPLKGVNSIGGLVTRLVNLFTKVLWIIAAIALLWSGFMYIKAQGNPDAVSEAHARFKNVLIGIAIIVGANTIASVVENLVKSLSN